MILASIESFATTILSEKIIFKGRIAADSELPAKNLYAMEIRIQRWLGECLKFEDRLIVNDRLISFDKVFEMVMNSTMNVSLPPNFVKPTPKNSPTSNKVKPAREEGKRKGGKKRKSGKADGERITKNVVPISEFLMKDGKNWKEHFAGKCSKDCPNGTTPLSCACIGTSVVNALLTATTKQVTLECAPFPQQSAMNSRPTSPRFAGRTSPPPQPDFPGRGFAMPGVKKSLPTIPHKPHGQNFMLSTAQPQ